MNHYADNWVCHPIGIFKRTIGYASPVSKVKYIITKGTDTVCIALTSLSTVLYTHQ